MNTTTIQSLAERLRALSEPIWGSLLEHRFPAGVATGELPLERFRFYLEQDRLFLDGYARALAAGAARSESDSELRSFASALRYTLEVERAENGRLLERVIAAGAPDSGGSVELAPAGRAYVSFLQEVAFTRSALELAAALLPCPWSYAEIGRSLSGAAPEQPVYRDWLAYLGSEQALSLSHELVRDFDARAARLGSGPLDTPAKLFRLAARYELAFWDAALDGLHWPDLATPHTTERNA